MSLTPQQTTALKVAILADPTLAPLSGGATVDFVGLQTALNAPTATSAWGIEVPVLTVEEAPAYVSFDSILAGKRDSWVIFLRNPRNFSKNKVRAWVVDIWGNATAGSNAEAVLISAIEFATKAQTLIGGNTKSTGTVSALDRSFTDDVTLDEVRKMFA